MASQLRVDKIVPVDGAPTGGGGGIIQIVQATLDTKNFNYKHLLYRYRIVGINHSKIQYQ